MKALILSLLIIQTYTVVFSQIDDYRIGTTWTYEQAEYLGESNSIIGFKTTSIIDTFTRNNINYYTLENGDTLYRKDQQMYFWDEYFKEYIMYYDFGEKSNYTIKYYDPFRESEEIAIVHIDSVSQQYASQKLFNIQHVTIENSGTFEVYKEDIIVGVGARNLGVKLLLGCGLCDNNPVTTQLRCFKNNEALEYKFSEVSCDSTWTNHNFLTYEIGSKWTFESINHPTSSIGFQQYQIIDTVTWMNEHAYKISPGLYSQYDYMIRKDKKVYFWDEESEQYQLNYDFGNDTFYPIKYKSGEGIDTSVMVYIDSVSNRSINNISYQVQHCRSTLGIGTIEFPFEVIIGLGQKSFGPRLAIGKIIDNITNDIQGLRCYSDSRREINLTAVACDSTWFTTYTIETEPLNVSVYPNPTMGMIYIDGINSDLEYKLYNVLGILISHGKTTNNSIEISEEGEFILLLRARKSWSSHFIIKTY